MPSTREQELIEAFVKLADSLVADYDVADLLHRLVTRCAQTLHAADAGILLLNSNGTFQVAASTSERGRLIELLQLDADQGPCLEAHYTGDIVSVDDLQGSEDRWPSFTAAAGELGYQSMHAIPLRLRDQTIGSLNLFGDRPGPLSDEDARAARGLADIVTIGILQERALRHASDVNDQLQHALTSRVTIEQAKGIVARSQNIGMDEAFEQLRLQARSTNRKITDVAQDIINALL